MSDLERYERARSVRRNKRDDRRCNIYSWRKDGDGYRFSDRSFDVRKKKFANSFFAPHIDSPRERSRDS